MNQLAGNNATGFHAGRYLSELLASQGHDMVWLSGKTGLDMTEMCKLLACSNMEAGLFVRLGEAISPSFLQDLERLMFNDSPTTQSGTPLINKVYKRETKTK